MSTYLYGALTVCSYHVTDEFPSESGLNTINKAESDQLENMANFDKSEPRSKKGKEKKEILMKV